MEGSGGEERQMKVEDGKRKETKKEGRLKLSQIY